MQKKVPQLIQQIVEYKKEPICFYCRSTIKPGEQIINKGDSKYYHKECFDKLFTLTSKCLRCTNVSYCLSSTRDGDERK